jgi:hypothetical protein
MLATGNEFTVTVVPVDVAEHPLAVAVTVNVAELFTETDVAVDPLLH